MRDSITKVMAPKRPQKTNEPHAWDRCAAAPLQRRSPLSGEMEPIDPGVRFFVLALEALGAVTRFSCEGHPRGFYVAFNAPYALALEIKHAGYFSVEVEGDDLWSVRMTAGDYLGPPWTKQRKADVLRSAAEAWMRNFGPKLAALA